MNATPQMLWILFRSEAREAQNRSIYAICEDSSIAVTLLRSKGRDR